MGTLYDLRNSETIFLENHKHSGKSQRDATLIEFRSKLRQAEELISKLGFSLREIQEKKRRF